MSGPKLKQFLKETTPGVLPIERLQKPNGGFDVPISKWLKSELHPMIFWPRKW
jgi:hypothetical protein